MPFRGDVVVKPIRPRGRRWELVEGFSYEGTTDVFHVPKGFTTDFASVPRVFVWLLPRYGQWTQSAILHDFLWDLARTTGFNKADADGIFNRSMRELGVPFLRRWIMWAAVRFAAGPRSWIEGGLVNFARMISIGLPTLALVAIPGLVVMITLLIGILAEAIVYVPLRLLHRTQRKEVNAPEMSDVLTS